VPLGTPYLIPAVFCVPKLRSNSAQLPSSVSALELDAQQLPTLPSELPILTNYQPKTLIPQGKNKKK